MKELIPNDWPRIRAFYECVSPIILGGRRDEWAIDPYAWEECRGINMTPIEAWLWADIRQANAIFYPQYPVDRFFVDFANPVAKVAIECDGREYHQDQEKDRARDAVLEAAGWSVYRITGSDCATDQDEETGALGRAAVFVRSIADWHRLRRNHRTGFVSLNFGRFAGVVDA